MILIPGLLGGPITMATFICSMWCWILWSPHHDNQRCRMAINNYPLSRTKPENWVWLSQRTGSYHALPHLKQLYSKVLWQQGFQLELIMSFTWEYVAGRPYFSILQGTKTWREVEMRPTCTHISTWYIICETHTTNEHMLSKRVCRGTFLEPIA